MDKSYGCRMEILFYLGNILYKLFDQICIFFIKIFDIFKFDSAIYIVLEIFMKLKKKIIIVISIGKL